jgi:hypothetical protein
MCRLLFSSMDNRQGRTHFRKKNGLAYFRQRHKKWNHIDYRTTSISPSMTSLLHRSASNTFFSIFEVWGRVWAGSWTGYELGLGLALG